MKMTRDLSHCPSRQPKYYKRYMKLYSLGYRTQVPALGISRRVQALHAIGYSRPQLMAATGLDKNVLYRLSNKAPKRVTRETAQAVIETYRTLCVQPLHNTTSAKRARIFAAKQGWYPPMAWDDIDNPKDRPSYYPKRRTA